MPSELYVKGSTSGAKAQFAEWFASDLTPDLRTGKAADFIIELELSGNAAAAGELEYTTDSGSTWFKLGDGAQAINITARTRILVEEGDTFNMRYTNATGTTVDRCVVVADMDA
jgi:hypothetical protein